MIMLFEGIEPERIERVKRPLPANPKERQIVLWGGLRTALPGQRDLCEEEAQLSRAAQAAERVDR
jgi:hypothetical protein